MRFWRRKSEANTKDATEDVAKVDAVLPPPLLAILQSVQEVPWKPPVTLVLLGVMYLLHLQVKRTPLLHLFALCPSKVAANNEIGAIGIAPFIHFEELHLYQSMLSLFWKGYKLEARLGSLGFCILLIYLIALSQALIVVGAHLLAPGAKHECFTGFSGVLTAMKVVLNVNSPAFTNLNNLRLPTKHAAWLELFLTYYLVPKLPLLAQGAGFIAGYLYAVTPNGDALVKFASSHVFQFFARIGLVKRRSKWWQVWPKFVASIRQRKVRRAARKSVHLQ